MTMYALKKTLKTNDMSLESTATTAWTNTVAELLVIQMSLIVNMELRYQFQLNETIHLRKKW